MDPTLWGLERRDGRLWMDGQDLTGLSHRYGTPLHVASARRLRERCVQWKRAFEGYPGACRIHFSYKTNLVAGLLAVLHEAGLGAEVVNGYELWLALQLGVHPDGIVMNGPNKREEELRAAVEAGIGLLVVDGLEELGRLEDIAAELDRPVRIGLRVCPDIVPRHMNTSSLTGSRRNQFGLDLRGGEVEEALRRAVASPHLDLRGLMAHIGSGIHDLRAFQKAVERLLDVHVDALRAGARPTVLDLGGGLGTCLSREFTTLEMLTYLGLGRLPRPPRPAPPDLVERYARAVVEAMETGCARRKIDLPELVLEPGRAIASDAQVLLLTVGAVRERPGVGSFALTDGGAM
ncbi:MAG: hypothetical protein JRJ84_10910, partial [Deltaproteobacteria bacterium]|nr:hypothetical protein [Deltaproteobacteria bacterium]